MKGNGYLRGNRGSLGVALLAASLACSSPAAAAGRPVLLSYFRTPDLVRIAELVARSGIPEGTKVYLGTYGVNRGHADAAHRMPGGRYAPILAPQKRLHPVRKLMPGEAGRLPAGHERFVGEIPRLLGLSEHECYRWGLEMGRRTRDNMRRATRYARPPVQVDTFQLDEIWPSTSAGGEKSAVLLPYMEGVLDGVHLGRPELGDRPRAGFIHVAKAARLFAMPASPRLDRFLRALDRASYRVIGESYFSFGHGLEGARWAAAHSMLPKTLAARHGAAGRSLAAKYMVGATPGDKQGLALGGRLPGMSRAEAQVWRATFIAEALRLGSAGFSEYNWTPQEGAPDLTNAEPRVMASVLRAIAAGLRSSSGK